MNDVHNLARAPRALVVGAGIAGLTAAAVLRGRGWDVEVVESADSLRRGGYKIGQVARALQRASRFDLPPPAQHAKCHDDVADVTEGREAGC